MKDYTPSDFLRMNELEKWRAYNDQHLRRKAERVFWISLVAGIAIGTILIQAFLR